MSSRGRDSRVPAYDGDDGAGLSVEHYDLELDYAVPSNRLEGRARLRVVAGRDLDRVVLELAALRVDKVRVDGRRAKHTHRGTELRITPPAPLRAGAVVEVVVDYAGHPEPRRGRWGDVGWEELTDGVVVASQPDGAPSWFPCHDHPADKATYRISITAGTGYEVVANGELVEVRDGPGRTTWIFEQAQPMATYLATVQVGRYRWLELGGADGGGGREVAVAVAVPDRLRRAAEHDFARQPEMVAVFSELFGPYPFDAYAAVVTDDDLEIPVEAQGLSVFGANHVDGRRGSERLVAHELAHQWFGNSLTVRRWRDIWLHEGFACYAEWLWSERSGGASAETLAGRAWRGLDDAEQDLVVADPGPDDMFDDRLYKRGALTLHVLRGSLGDDGFFALLREWTAAHRHAGVDADELLALVADRGGDDLVALLRRWLEETALPQLPGR